MALRLYNTLTKRKDLFEPIEPGKVSIYVCGPTVYDVPHIGHARSVYVFDLLRKYLEKSGYEVEFVRNVTDIDDKIIGRARTLLESEGREISSQVLLEKTRLIAEKYLCSYLSSMAALGAAEPTRQPKATDNIAEMIKAIGVLIDKGHAYVSSGEVYFDIASFDDYGKLSGRDKGELIAGARVDPSENKRSPADFALWKRSKSDEPSWPSPWGEGRPGWHIECSVMSTGSLGASFDIHGGGLDLIFPHHENEIAQAEALTGCPFANWWVHNGLLTVEGEKMSKSLGNYITMENFFSEYGDSDQLKLIFLSAHYRKSIDLTKDRILEAARVKERLVIFMEKAARLRRSHGSVKPLEELQVKMTEAMDEDLNTPKAFKILMEAVGKGNEAFAAGEDMGPDQVEQILACSELVREWTELFGLTLEPEAATEEERERIEDLIALRAEARAQKDYEKSDRIRDELAAKGVTIEDTQEGTVWRKN